MDDLFKLRQYGTQTVVSFYTPTLINAAEVERVRADLLRLVDEGKQTRLILDFKRVQFFSSQLIGVLLTLNKKLAAGGGGGLILCGVSERLMELLKISRLDRLLTIKGSRKEALGG